MEHRATCVGLGGSRVRFLLSMLILFSIANCRHCLYEVDSNRYDEGKRQLEVIQKNSMLPSYGLCWTNTMKSLLSGCKQLTDVEQSRLALAYLNCFLLVQGKQHYSCEPSQDIKTCTASMTDADSASFTTFFTHTQNICYFLEAQAWHETTERTISLLSSSSQAVADQLDRSSSLQQEVIKQQKLSLHNQNLMLDQAANLSSTINTSSNSIHNMFTEFKESTNEQRQLINDIFDRVSQLQSTVLGEFSWFYSFVYYVLSVVMCYILTSTPRTNSARFWLFCLMTLNAIAENVLVSMVTEEGSILYAFTGVYLDKSEVVYRFQWLCRKMCACVGGILVIYCAVTFRDINLVNNTLLNEIRSQNEELKIWLKGKQNKAHKVGKATPALAVEELKCDPHSPETNTTGYESESKESSDEEYQHEESHQINHFLNHSHTPSSHTRSTTSAYPTYIQPLSDTDDSDSVSSFCTALTGRSEVTGVSTRSSKQSDPLQWELQDLHNSTPVKDLSGNLLNWATCGRYKGVQGAQESNLDKTTEKSHGQRGHSAQIMDSSAVPRRYSLRQRKPPSHQNSDDLQSESSRSFSRKVKHLEKTSARNSRLVRKKIIYEEKITASSDDDK